MNVIVLRPPLRPVRAPSDSALRFSRSRPSYVTLRYAELTGTPRNQITIITVQLGNGCSASAIRHGESVDTSGACVPGTGLALYFTMWSDSGVAGCRRSTQRGNI
jgi:hypothetical protein